MSRKMIQVDPVTHKRLRVISAEHGVTIKDFVSETVAQCNEEQVLKRIRESKQAKN